MLLQFAAIKTKSYFELLFIIVHYTILHSLLFANKLHSTKDMINLDVIKKFIPGGFLHGCIPLGLYIALVKSV